MTVLFKGGPDLMTRSRDGRNFILCEDKDIVSDSGIIYRMPVGAVSDGASIPQEFWSLGLTPFGDYWPATFAHDLAYRNTLLRQLENGFWVPAMLNRDDSDLLLLDCMTALGVDIGKKEAIYDGVRLGGGAAFNKDRAQ